MVRKTTCSVCRRSFLVAAGAGAATATAGCLGDDEDDEPVDDTDTADDTDDEGLAPEDYPDFDPPDTVEFPQRLSTVIDHEYHLGLIEELEQVMENPIDEPRYGDPPTEHPYPDEDEWIDPDTLFFSFTPAEDPAGWVDSLGPIIDNIEEETGLPVDFEPIDSYAAQVEATRAERLHIAGYGAGTAPFAVNIADAYPFAVRTGDDTFGYRVFGATHVDRNDINSIEDFAGESGFHADPSSNSGNLFPRAVFAEEFGVVPGEDYEVEHVGSHENVAVGLYMGDTDVAPLCSTCVARVADAGQIDADDIKIVYASDTLPTSCITHHAKLHPDIAEGVRSAFLDHYYGGTVFEEDMEATQYVEIDYATVWDPILLVQEDNEIVYDLDEV